MQISNNNSQTFGSIQVRLSHMNRNQRCISDRLFNSIKYDNKYSKLTSNVRAGEDLDIYMLPKGKGIEIRFMDPYSGNFVRKDNVIVRENLFSVISERVESVTDKVVSLYEQIKNGVIPRPKENISKFIKGETELDAINPAKKEDLYEPIQEFKRCGFSQKEAEEQAFDQYTNLYHMDNKDADF